MKTLEIPKISSRAANTAKPLCWQLPPWMKTTDSAIKLQRIWVETCHDAARRELEILTTMVFFYSRLSHCMLVLGGLRTPASMAFCYQEITDDMADSTWENMRKITEFSDELKERIWCEI